MALLALVVGVTPFAASRQRVYKASLSKLPSQQGCIVIQLTGFSGYVAGALGPGAKCNA
jgi:hypothetical protein